METISAMPAAPKEHPTQRTELRLVEPDAKSEQKQTYPDANLSYDEVEDMWDNMPV